MKNGFYLAKFTAPTGSGGALVVLRDGKILGGDVRQYYFGNYSISGSQFTAKIQTNLHSTPPGTKALFGSDNVSLSLTATVQGDADASFTAVSANAPNMKATGTPHLLSE